MTKVIIDRTKWLRGEGGDKSYLLRATDHKMCCLGFYCLNKKFTNNEIVSIAEFSEFNSEHKEKLTEFGYEEETKSLPKQEIVDELMKWNDRKDCYDDEREAEIIKLGNQVGIEFSFIN